MHGLQTLWFSPTDQTQNPNIRFIGDSKLLYVALQSAGDWFRMYPAQSQMSSGMGSSPHKRDKLYS